MRTLFFVFLLFIAGNAMAYPTSKLVLPAGSIDAVYDGDTFTISLDYLPDVFGLQLPVRIKGIDTPEMRSSCSTLEQRNREKELAIRSKETLQAILQDARRIDLIDLGRDKYFRLLAIVIADGRNVSDILIEKGLAVPYDGGTKVGWCGQ